MRNGLLQVYGPLLSLCIDANDCLLALLATVALGAWHDRACE